MVPPKSIEFHLLARGTLIIRLISFRGAGIDSPVMGEAQSHGGGPNQTPKHMLILVALLVGILISHEGIQ